MNNFTDVVAFHEKYKVPCAAQPSLLDEITTAYRVNFMQEELNEFLSSYNQNDLEGCADALVDLVYVAMGTAVIMGLPWEQLWKEVQRANMEKRLAKPDGSDSKRGSPLDVIKPPGWVGPDHSAALAGAGGRFDALAALEYAAEWRKNGDN